MYSISATDDNQVLTGPPPPVKLKDMPADILLLIYIYRDKVYIIFNKDM